MIKWVNIFFKRLYIAYALIVSLIIILLMAVCFIPLLLTTCEKHYCGAYYIFHYAFQIQLLLVGIRIEKKYSNKNLAATNKCVFVSNHLSYLDALVVTAGIDNVFRPLGKAGITTIPLIGFLYKQYVITVDRKSIQSKKNSLKEMKKTLDNEHSILLFPEGTFYTEIIKTLNEFKDGAFHLAIENKVLVQPILLYYTRERWHPDFFFSLNPGKIIIEFLDAVESYDYELSQASELKNKVYALMEAALNKNNYPIKTNTTHV